MAFILLANAHRCALAQLENSSPRLHLITDLCIAGIVPGKMFDPTKAEDEAMEKEPLTKSERTKLIVFVTLNLICGLITGGASAYIYFTKLVPNPEEQSNRIIFALLGSISGTSIFGVLAVRERWRLACPCNFVVC